MTDAKRDKNWRDRVGIPAFSVWNVDSHSVARCRVSVIRGTKRSILRLQGVKQQSKARNVHSQELEVE